MFTFKTVESLPGEGKLAKLEKLKSLREKVNWEVKEERYELLARLGQSLGRWQGQPPDLREIFQGEEIDRLLLDSTDLVAPRMTTFVPTVALSGYKDEPELDEAGKPVLRRTTPIHQAYRYHYGYLPALFEIYDRFDANYIDESGLTHFHAACELGRYDVVEKFLEHGQDPNVVWRETGDSPLILALRYLRRRVAELLLRSGADPNLANAKGETPLHVICSQKKPELVQSFFQICDEKHLSVKIDARNELGDRPLHLALRIGNRKAVESLLRGGADPMSLNKEGSTPLHIICETGVDGDSMEIFFKICDEIHRVVQVDATDRRDRTPLQRALTYIMPRTLDVLLDRGADLSSFVYPTEAAFIQAFDQWLTDRLDFKLLLASGVVACVERLEKRGYETHLSDAVAIMQLFAKHELFEKSADLDRSWYDDEEFAREARWTMIRPDLSLHDLIREQLATNRSLANHEDYLEFWWTNKLEEFLPEEPFEACARHLCETISRRFFKKWGLVGLVKLTSQRLSILSCDVIVDMLVNADLYTICLAASDQDTTWNSQCHGTLACFSRRAEVTRSRR
ncbi:uncharacterized protein LOC106649173 isoform X1 [Trichogramma pretiosum]|uniref:uncharacterized protein LOC106649173 isoform X1 n=1 Tax=Trichogramma pretiosum TaxID=7493 RepID=UPI0006C9B772|nr:uncharacterized protein LOC106649173 isoform X1 [Trichogramma pretiosum]